MLNVHLCLWYGEEILVTITVYPRITTLIGNITPPIHLSKYGRKKKDI
jgi:hypothetical protein